MGGTAIPFNASAAYDDGYNRLCGGKWRKAVADFGATALITNHSEFDNAYFKPHTATERKPEANPFDGGKDGVARYFAVVQTCATATRIRTAGQ